MRRGFGCWLFCGALGFAGCGGGAFGSADSSSSGGASGSAHAGSSSPSGDGAGADSSGGRENGGAAGGGGDSASGAPAAGEGGSVEPSGCPCSAPTPTCEDSACVVRGPTMVKAGSFYVDATEVTNADYTTFMKAKGNDTSQQAPACGWNDSFEPALSVMGPDAVPSHPITNIDYCDAAAYCAWADKRLCGKIGGGNVAFADLASPEKSQWFAACGGPKGQLYPYGSVHKDGACNDASGSGKLLSAGATQECSGFYPGLSDMLGNAAEWVDSCDADSGAVDGCETIGGSYADTTTCNMSSLKHRNEQSPLVGFRCCSQ